MKPFECRKHGPIEPYIVTTAKRIYRECPICKRARSKKRNEEKAQEIREYHQKWYAEKREHALAISAQYRENLRKDVIAGYGGKCECCGETALEFLTIDHVNGGGYKLRKTTQKGAMLYRELRRRGYPKDGYRLLCMNCNFSLGRFGYCPHTLTAANPA